LIDEHALLRSAAATGEVPLACEQRKLAAILAADDVVYSRLMGRDESGTLARLAAISTRIVAA
jgi:class 3 adenylate cyclase